MTSITDFPLPPQGSAADRWERRRTRARAKRLHGLRLAPGVRMLQSSAEILAVHLEWFVCSCCRSRPGVNAEEIARRAAGLIRKAYIFAMQLPGQAARRQLKAIRDELWTIIDERVGDAEEATRLKARVAIILDQMLAAVWKKPETAADPRLVIRLADHRQEIRESRAYEATTGPPRPKTATAPESESEADRFLNSSALLNRQANLIPSEKNNQTEFFGAPSCARNVAENLAARRPCAAA